jgi:hypothetical protein
MTNDRENLRKCYLALKSGARLTTEDVDRLLRSGGAILSGNRLRELGRDSDRGLSITSAELYVLISEWAKEQRRTEAT